MPDKVVEVPHFEGEPARVVVGDFGPFGIEMISFQVLREKRKWWGGKRPTWVSLRSTFFDAQKGLNNGYTFDSWLEYMSGWVRQWVQDDLDEVRARDKFYAQD